MRFLRLAALAGLACAALAARAQQTLEIIPLRHATVEQVLPSLRPLLEPGGTLTGDRGQLIVRASPSTIADIKLALEVLDRAPRRLQISVRFDDASADSRQALEASGRISNRGSDVELRAEDSRGTRGERVDQRVQVVEGGRAFIATGQSRPLPQRQRIQTPAGVVAQETFVMQEAVTGFEVVPRLAGDRVFLDLAPQRQSFGPGGQVQETRLSSSPGGRLGEWFELGALSASGVRDDRGIAAASGSRSSESRRVWVKVEEVRN